MYVVTTTDHGIMFGDIGEIHNDQGRTISELSGFRDINFLVPLSLEGLPVAKTYFFWMIW